MRTIGIQRRITTGLLTARAVNTISTERRNHCLPEILVHDALSTENQQAINSKIEKSICLSFDGVRWTPRSPPAPNCTSSSVNIGVQESLEAQPHNLNQQFETRNCGILTYPQSFRSFAASSLKH
ncbi:hypothetical protein DK847_16625 [Aestuariivirga litoralis]|uniref:Uncharacterized protein n=1 Tax=Aestuariivirga litoralis TaxID=2650924 RepID=A0A2W2AK20_9HYPH|nr:hypothetical protein DK847_16625 [Aestuariivirga litoralis]